MYVQNETNRYIIAHNKISMTSLQRDLHKNLGLWTITPQMHDEMMTLQVSNFAAEILGRYNNPPTFLEMGQNESLSLLITRGSAMLHNPWI